MGNLVMLDRRGANDISISPWLRHVNEGDPQQGRQKHSLVALPYGSTFAAHRACMFGEGRIFVI